MPIEPTPFQEFDPEEIFDEIPTPGMIFEEVYCCECIDGDVSLCVVENGFGEVLTQGAALTIAFWYSTP